MNSTKDFNYCTLKKQNIHDNATFLGFCHNLIDRYYKEYTVQDGIGRWDGKFEDCKIVTFVIEKGTKQYLDNICTWYCNAFDQDSVLITTIDCEAKLWKRDI